MARRSTRALGNGEIARTLREMSLFLEMEGVEFKPRAYEKAAYSVEASEQPVRELWREGGAKAIQTLPSIGKGIAEKIAELLETGRIEELEVMRRKTPVDVLALTAVEGLGARMVKALHDRLGIRTLAHLEKAARRGHIRELPHFGEKSEQKILRGIEFQKQAGGRMPIGQVLALAREIEVRLSADRHVKRAVAAGSLRRRRETVGDLDFLVVSGQPEAVMERFVSMPEVVHVHAHGSTKSMVRLAVGIDADLRVVEEESFGAALHYFTGSKDHNVVMRRIAQDAGLKLNEYGLFRGRKRVAGRTEEEVFEALDLAFIPPELREDRGEIEAARRGSLPELIEPGSLRGDLQIQTDWTDGANSIEDMVEAARALGLEYVAITDHTRDLTMARGCDEQKLLEQRDAIRKLNERLRGFRVLSGAEVNIRADGSLDVADEVLAKLDVVGAAVHGQFKQSRAQMTKRLIRAMENPHVDVLFHPTCRALGRREAVNLDFDAILETARRTGTALEIDAQPERLDLKDEHVRKAVEAGVPLVIDSDAHSVKGLRYLDEYGIPLARRGWATAADVLNTRPVTKLLAALKDGRRRRKAAGKKSRKAPSRARRG